MGTTKAKQQVLFFFFYFSERKRECLLAATRLFCFVLFLFSSSGFTVSTESNSEQWRGVDVERECERGSELIVVIRRLI